MSLYKQKTSSDVYGRCDNALNPQGDVIRTEVDVILLRFSELT